MERRLQKVERGMEAAQMQAANAQIALDSVLNKMDKSTDAIYKLMGSIDLLVHKSDKLEAIVEKHEDRIRDVEDAQLVRASAWETLGFAKRAFVTALTALIISAIAYYIKTT